MNEQPLERLNYFSGQRLDAADFRLEQEYHIRVQQWLMRSLFTPGVALGLDISVEERKASAPDGTPITVHVAVVHPGAALDALGRAIILVEPTELPVHGEFLTVRYQERKVAPQQDGCVLPSKVKGAPVHPTWGGPSRIQSEPFFAWRALLPENDTLELVLAQFELDAQCRVTKTMTGARRYANASPVARVQTFALEGEKDIDAANAKKIYFHIRGRRPEAVTLYLRAAQFSTLYYTELGQHDHGLSYKVGPPDKIDAHTHGVKLSLLKTAKDGAHPHTQVATLVSRIDVPDVINLTSKSGFRMVTAVEEVVLRGDITKPFPPFGQPEDIAPLTRMLVRSTGSEHEHGLPDATSDANSPANNSGMPSHTHVVTPSETARPGAAPAPAPHGVQARTGPQLTFVKNLHIIVDKVDQTEMIRRQIERMRSMEDWSSLGNGEGDHAFVTSGTGAIRLDFLPKADFSPGDHEIELLVSGDGNGGHLYYNLYVE